MSNPDRYIKMQKDYTKLNVQEALEYTNKHYHFSNIRQRIRSKSIAWILARALEQAVGYIYQLENENKDLKENYNELLRKIQPESAE